MDSQNEVMYDADMKVFWLKVGQAFLFPVKEPVFNFSESKTVDFIESYYCMHYIPKEGDVIIDIGAGIGTEALYFSRKIGANGVLLSVEASLESFNLLSALCDKNGLTNTINVHAAISDQEGTLWMEETEEYQLNKVNTEKQGIEVRAITLNTLVKEHNLSRVDLLKVNIEGAEFEMIEGMSEMVGMVNNVAISCHDFLFDNKPIKARVIDYLTQHGFEVVEKQTGRTVEDSWVYGKREPKT
ncbi:MAG: hypothetical protein Roseis2KO_37310 [Roseivirga sp.]